MNLEPIKKTASLTSDTLAQYVSDVANTEAAIFTLKKMEGELKTRKTSLLDSANKKTQDLQSEIVDLRQQAAEAASQKISLQEYTKKQKPDDPPPVVSFIAEAVGMGIGLFIPVFVVEFLLFMILADVEVAFSSGLFWIIFLIALLTISILLEFAKTSEERGIIKKEYQQYLDTLSEEIKCTTIFLEGAMEEFEEAQENLANAKIECNILDKQFTDTRTKRQELEGHLQSLYAMGIIPPDYRAMDCVLVFDFIFRNGLADTMREAVTNYEERVFRGEVIKGMDSILRSINNLTAGMSMVVTRLNSINQNVSMMSQDLYQFSQSMIQKQQSSQAATERLIEETKLGRYATEQLHYTTKRIAYYNDLLPR